LCAFYGALMVVMVGMFVANHVSKNLPLESAMAQAISQKLPGRHRSAGAARTRQDLIEVRGILLLANAISWLMPKIPAASRYRWCNRAAPLR
jgi:hypothetical protein